MKTNPLTILYQDSVLLVVCKPSGLHVHPTALSLGEPSVLTILRDQVGAHVYPCHRLDRATSGVLVFALDSATARNIGEQFQSQGVRKLYLALVRGWVPLGLEIDTPLGDEGGEPRPSFTSFSCIEHYEFPLPIGDFSSTRASLVLAQPRSGRRHQIRRHAAGARHPVIGDRVYGDRHHNRFHVEHSHLTRLQLFSLGIGFMHPIHKTWLSVFHNPCNEEDTTMAIFRAHLKQRFGTVPTELPAPVLNATTKVENP